MKTLLRILPALFLILSISYADSSPEEFHPNTVNAVLGDLSYIETFEEQPAESASEELRIKTHLEFVIDLLKKADISTLEETQKENRSKLITLLEDYKKAGIFPNNHHFETRKPVFIDEEGNLCTVGYLIAQTKGLEAAKRINRSHKFDYIKDIDPKLIDSWLAENGLTKKEAAMIQPTYHYKENKNNIETSYLVGSSLLAGLQTTSLSYSLLVDNSYLTQRRVSSFNVVLGLSSVTLGIINLDNTKTKDIDGFWSVTYTNETRTNFSKANILFGGISALVNTVRFKNAEKTEQENAVNLTSTQIYNPSSHSYSPGLLLSVKF